MKKTLTKKLSINKKTVADLSNLEMQAVEAGNSITATCPERCTDTAWQFCTYGCPSEVPYYCTSGCPTAVYSECSPTRC